MIGIIRTLLLWPPQHAAAAAVDFHGRVHSSFYMPAVLLSSALQSCFDRFIPK
jgi:hypothetical protein